MKTEKTDALLEELRDVVELLGSALGEREYILGEFSAADLCIGYHLYYTGLWPELKAVIESNVTVLRYLERLRSRPAAVKSEVFTYEP